MGVLTWLSVPPGAPWSSCLLSSVKGPTRGKSKLPLGWISEFAYMLGAAPGQVDRGTSSWSGRDSVPSQPSRICALVQGAPHSTTGSAPSGRGTVHKPLSISVVFSHLYGEGLYCLCAPGSPSSFSPWGLAWSVCPHRWAWGFFPLPFPLLPALPALLVSSTEQPPRHPTVFSLFPEAQRGVRGWG